MSPTLEIMIGDVRAKLLELKARGQKVKMVVTSPPYWGLRDYGTEPQIWGGHPNCSHPRLVLAGSIHRGGPQGKTGALITRDRTAADAVKDRRCGEFCLDCGAWRGELGLEPTPQLWVEHIVEVFALVWEVLEDDGTLWVNFGDCYTDGGRGKDTGSTLEGSRDNQKEARKATTRTMFKGLGPKNLVGQPWRAAFALQDWGWTLRQDIIWAKPSPMPESVRDRFTKAHEYLFLFSKQPRYYFDQEAIKEPVTGGAHARGNGVNPKAMKPVAGHDHGPGAHDHLDFAKPKKLNGRAERGLSHAGKFGHEAGWRNKQNESFSGAVNGLVDKRNKRSVWWITSEPYPEAHYATFPTALVRTPILAGSRPGDTVLDIFGGSGTVGEVGNEYGRNVILIDLNPANEALMRDRCSQTPGLPL